MIDVSDLTKTFGQHTAVSELSFQLERGEVVGFLGPNGAGKTTTMRILTGYLPPTRGSVRVAGFDVLRESIEVRRRIGYLPENVPLYREHRVEEMLRFHGRLHRMPRAELERRIDEVLERVDLTDRRRTRIGSLSRGLRQRAGLAVALLPRPEVLVLDEPTSGLDPLQRVEVRALIRELASEHTVLLSSHILAEVEAVCPRVVILARGKMAADGRPEELVGELGGGSSVRLEAVMPDPERAKELLLSLPGVDAVEYDGVLGIHHQFDVIGADDLREDVGALAMSQNWALRELSWRRPTLEQLFTRLALDLDVEEPAAGPRTEPAAPSRVASGGDDDGDDGLLLVAPMLAGGSETPQAPAEEATRTLNPFENFGGGGAEPAAPPQTLNPFENFGGGGAAPDKGGAGESDASEADAGDGGADGDDG